VKIEVVKKKTDPEEYNGFCAISPVENWGDTLDSPSILCCEIDTSALSEYEESIFFEALRVAQLFYRVKNHKVFINDFVTGLQKNGLYWLVARFGLKIDC
jgi:hypothetical protein